MDPAARRPWERLDQFAIAWALANVNAVLYLAYCVGTWRAAIAPDPSTTEENQIGYASIVTGPTLILLLAAVALL